MTGTANLNWFRFCLINRKDLIDFEQKRQRGNEIIVRKKNLRKRRTNAEWEGEKIPRNHQRIDFFPFGMGILGGEISLVSLDNSEDADCSIHSKQFFL